MQDFIAILIAIIAAAFLARRGWQTIARKRSGCGACSHCPPGDPAIPANLVTISPIVPHAKAPRREESVSN